MISEFNANKFAALINKTFDRSFKQRTFERLMQIEQKGGDRTLEQKSKQALQFPNKSRSPHTSTLFSENLKKTLHGDLSIRRELSPRMDKQRKMRTPQSREPYTKIGEQLRKAFSGTSSLFRKPNHELNLDRSSKTTVQDVMKIGDVIYFKYSTQVLFQGDNKLGMTTIRWPGYLVGDGLSSERLYCMHQRRVSDFSISKFLFKVELAKKSFVNKRYDDPFRNGMGEAQAGGDHYTELQRKKEADREYEESKKECKGLPITYGQNIILRHIQSNTFLALNTEELARQIGSVQVCLKKEINHLSNMTILPSSRVREMGDFVRYSDTIYMANAFKSHYYVHASGFLTPHEVGLEINGSEMKTEWKPHLFRAHSQIGEGGPNTPLVCPGDIINIQSKHFGGFLSIKATSQEELLKLSQRQAPKKKEKRKNKRGHHSTNLDNMQELFDDEQHLQQIELANKINPDNIKRIRKMVTSGGDSDSKMHRIGMPYEIHNQDLGYSYSLKLEICDKPSLYGYWEIENLEMFNSEIVGYDQTVRIKNIATKQYLARDPKSSTRLIVSQDANSPYCLFTFRTKIPVSKNGYLSCQDLVRIEDCNGNYVQIQKSENFQEVPQPWEFSDQQIGAGVSKPKNQEIDENQDNPYYLLAGEKNDSAFVNFELVKCERDRVEVSKKLSSLLPDFVSFLVFLQGWGIKESPTSSPVQMDSWKSVELDFEHACEKEKDLEIEKDSLEENLKNLLQFLQESSSESSQVNSTNQTFGVKSMLKESNILQYKDKQDYILQQHILEVLMKILEYIFFICFETLKTLKSELDFEDEKGALQAHSLMKFEMIINTPDSKLEKLPQMVARRQLDLVMKTIIKIVLLCCRNSEKSSLFLTNYKQFFLKLLFIYPQDVPDLMEEIASNLGGFGSINQPLLRHDDRFLSQQEGDTVQEYGGQRGGFDSRQTQQRRESQNLNYQGEHQQQQQQQQVQKPGNTSKFGNRDTKYSYTYRRKQDINQLWKNKNAGTYNIQGGDEGPHQDAEGEAEEDFQPEQIEIVDPDSKEDTDFHVTWTSQLRDVNASEGNIGNQIFLFDMLSALMYNKKTGVSSKKYQELIYNELFGKEPNSNNGGYLKFAVQSKSNLPDDGPILVIFCTRNTESIKHFKENNTVLVNHKGDVDGKVNEIYINLDELSKKSELDEVRIYLHYISSFIRMMAIMCRSRFDKAIKKCTEKGDSSIGLSMSFCLLAFQKVGIDTSIKVALLEFYNAVFIDKHPLKPLSQYTNRCFSFDTISKRLITQKAILWLNEEITKQMDHSVWLDQYNVREINIFVSTIIKKAFCDPNIQALTKPEIDISVKLDLLKFQSKVLELIYSFIDFGYAQTSMVISCINLCTLVLTTEFYNDFAMCIEMKDYPAQIALHVFYREARKSIELYGAHRQVILNALKILRLVGKYRTLLQLQVMLQYFKQFKSNEDKICEELPKVFSMYPISVNQTKERVVAEAKYGEHQEEQWDTIVIDLFFKVQNIQPDPDSQEREEAQENESSSKLDGSSQFNKIRSQIDKVSQFNFSIDNILINTLFKLQKNTFRFEGSRVESIKQSMLTCDASDLNRKVEKELIGILVDYYNQRHTVLKELMKVELVKGPKEIELFKSLVNISLSNEDLENDNFDDFHGHDADSYLAEEDSEEGDNRGDQYIFSIQDLGDKVDKLLDLDKNPVESTQYLAIKDKIQKNLIQIIRKLNKMLKKMYSTKINYMKLQNLMRNLNYHKIFIKLFSLKGKDSKTVKILMLLIQFFELYTNSNPANQEVLQGFQNKFVDLTAREFGSDQSRKWYLDPSQIIKNLTSCIADQSEQSQLIDYIFSKINEIIEKGNMLIVFDLKNMGKSDLSQLKSIKIYLRKLICYKKILSGLIFNNKLEKRHQNQRLIISNLINSKKLVKLYEYKYFSEIKNLKVKDLDLIEFYNSFITLLAELSWDFKLGIKQCKRLITMEQLVEILTSRSTPYLLKKHFLKCFHHIIIDDGLTSSLKKKQRLIQDVLDLVISKDLQCFTQYLQGGEADGLPQDANLPNIHSRGHFRSRKNQGLQEDELILRKPSEFWHYVLSDQTIEEREYGLIYFTYSFISKCIKSREEGGFGVDYYEFSESFTKIRETLVNMMDRVRRREQDKSDFDANGTCYMVNQCLEIIPEIKKRNSKYPLQKLDKQFMQDNNSENGYSQQVYRYGYEQEEEDMINDEGTGDDESSDDENLRKKTNSRSLIPPIKHFLIKNRISYEKFIDLIIFKNTDDHVKLLGTILNTDEEIVLENVNQVLKLEFSGFKNLPQSEITIRHLTRALINFERQLMTYELKGKEQKLKMNMQGILDFLAGGRLIKQPENSSDSLKSEYFLFLQFYMNRALEDSKYDKELNPWVQKIRNFINRKEERHRKEYFNIFLGLLLKSGESYFLLRTLKQMLTQEMEESKNNIKENSSRAVGYINTEYRRKFTKVQNFYADCEVPLLCLSMINSSSKANLVDESSQVINYMLKHGNQTVQQYILNTFQSKIYTKSIFLYLKDIFRSMALELKSEIDDPLKNKPIIELNENMLILKFTENNSFKQITNIIDMLKLLCDGCYKNFQDYLRTQKSGSKDTYNPYSVNVINEVSEFLVLFLHENRESLEDAEKGEEVSNMINTCLDLLSEASIGPCLENQALLIRNRRLLDSINEILRLDIFNFQKMAVRQDIKNTVNKVQVEVFAEAINFINALVSGNNSTGLLEELLENIDRDAIQIKILTIYQFKIRKNKKFLTLDQYCRNYKRKLMNGSQTSSDDKRKEGCDELTCNSGYPNDFDMVLVDSVFVIFLIILHISDNLKGDERLKSFKKQNVDISRIPSLISNLNRAMNKNNRKSQREFQRILLLEKVAGKGLLPEGEEGHSYFMQRSKDSLASSKIQFNLQSRSQISLGHNNHPLNNTSNMKEYSSQNRSDNYKARMMAAGGTNGALNSQELKHGSNYTIAINKEKINKSQKFQKDLEDLGQVILCNIYEEARRFFDLYTASVEVMRNKRIERIYFRIPFFCKFITTNIRSDIIWNSNRDSDQERLETFFERVNRYKFEMKMRQSLSQYPIVYDFVKNWRMIKTCLFYLLLVINLIILLLFEHNHSTTGAVGDRYLPIDVSTSLLPDYFIKDGLYGRIFLVLNYSHLLGAVLILILSYIERRPVSQFRASSNEYFKKYSIKEENAKFQETSKIYKLLSKTGMVGEPLKKRPRGLKGYLSQVWSTLTDYEVLYNLVYFVISVASAYYHLCYPILLLDLVKRSYQLQNVLKSISNNFSLLLKTIILGLTVLYLYSVFGFVYFPQDFKHEEGADYMSYCHTLRHCFLSTITNGLRAEGGIGQAIGPLSLDTGTTLPSSCW